MEYSLDTSAIIDAWVRNYPIQQFPRLWKNLEALIHKQELCSTEEVLHELEKHDDEVYKWAKSQQKLFVPIDEEIQQMVADILKRHPLLVNSNKSRSGADPFVIALAQVNNCKVVTSERKSPNPTKKPHIPDVCDARQILCISLLDLIKEQRWVFN
jgi:predicted nucleic acid-binding protein